MVLLFSWSQYSFETWQVLDILILYFVSSLILFWQFFFCLNRISNQFCHISTISFEIIVFKSFLKILLRHNFIDLFCILALDFFFLFALSSFWSLLTLTFFANWHGLYFVTQINSFWFLKCSSFKFYLKVFSFN